MGEKREKVSNMVWMPARIMNIASICKELAIGNILEVVKHKIIGLNLSQITKDI